MSLKSWKAEFYPVNARFVNSANAVAHSLQKWMGLKLKNLEKHDIYRLRRALVDSISGSQLSINANSCALCQVYKNGDTCVTCPLFTLLKFPCDFTKEPYTIWANTGNPEPMIAALTEIVEK